MLMVVLVMQVMLVTVLLPGLIHRLPAFEGDKIAHGGGMETNFTILTLASFLGLLSPKSMGGEGLGMTLSR